MVRTVLTSMHHAPNTYLQSMGTVMIIWRFLPHPMHRLIRPPLRSCGSQIPASWSPFPLSLILQLLQLGVPPCSGSRPAQPRKGYKYVYHYRLPGARPNASKISVRLLAGFMRMGIAERTNLLQVSLLQVRPRGLPMATSFVKVFLRQQKSKPQLPTRMFLDLVIR